jgi:hypothetical protein
MSCNEMLTLKKFKNIPIKLLFEPKICSKMMDLREIRTLYWIVDQKRATLE